MKLAVSLPYAEGAMSTAELFEFVTRADQLGYHSVWAAEAWTFDAFQMLTALIPHTEQIGLATGIANVYSRTPALLGQSIATLDTLSDGRAILGLGTSGPQVVEGWHGVPFDRPMQRQRETIEIVRTILRRERLNYEGEIYKLDMGLKLINHPRRADVPIVLASLGPKNVELTAELADGWLPVLFSPEKADSVWSEPLAAGRAKRGDDLGDLEVIPSVASAVTDDPAMLKGFAKMGMALYLGGMGSREKNFYNQLFRRYGYVDEAKTVQDLYLDRQREEAVAAITDEMVDEVSAIGDAGYVKERFAAYGEAGASVINVSLIAFDQASRLSQLEELAELV
ncbi:MAG: LLM class F420-dependent oxidoreductase [Acidimicrobiia bacterium]|nr:LLM class F420-dependent oxidoreductase [Acidimicrobiia bacterium]